MTSSTKDRILDAAERLFAVQGFDAASLRQVTTEAGVNLAAVNYHFGSKRGLIEQVIKRRLGPLNQARLDLLAEREAAAAGRPVPLEDLLAVMFEPALKMARDPDGASFLHLLGRMHISAIPEPIEDFLYEQFEELRNRLLPHFAVALPHLTAGDMMWRAHFAIGSMLHTMSCQRGLEHMSEGLCQVGDLRADLHRLVEFCAAGMRAPTTPVAESNAKEPRS